MLIGIDARFAVHKRRGIGNYTLALISNLAKIDSTNQYVLYTDSDDKEKVLPLRDNFRVSMLSPANYALWEQYVLPRQAQKDGVDILHCTGNTAPLFLSKKIRLVTTIHDVMYLKDDQTLPHSASLYQRCGRLYRRCIVPKTIHQADKIITISSFSKKDIVEAFPDFKNDDIEVIYEAADMRFTLFDKKYVEEVLARRLGITGNYILTLGAIDPRKNTELILKTFIQLKHEGGFDGKLVVVGVPNWQQTKYYQIVQESCCQDDIIFTDFVEEDELILLYNAAAIFLYPSLYEGFGLPPLEAMACGVPVITSNTTSIPEITGNAALLINPSKGDELRQAIQRLINNESLRQELSERGLLQAKKFSWGKLAKETLAIYESLAGRRI